MGKIRNVTVIEFDSKNEFEKKLKIGIKEIQDKGRIADIKYSIAVKSNFEKIHSALLLEIEE